MEIVIVGFIIIIFIFLMVNKLYLYALIPIIIFIIYEYLKNSKKQNEDSFFTANNVQPLIEEQEDGTLGYVYALNDTATRQQNIEQAILYDNNNTLVEREFEGYSDANIAHFLKDETKKIYQYQDDFGIRDYKFGIINKELGLPILVRVEHEYKLVGYLNYNDANYFISNTNRVVSHRLIYQGGYYKQVFVNSLGKNEVVTNYEDYILKLVVFYKQKTPDNPE